MPQRVTERGRVLPAHRPAHRGDAVDIEPIKQLGDIACPIQHGAARLRIGQPDAGPVGGDQPDSALACDGTRGCDVEAAGQTAMGIDDRKAVTGAEFGETH